MMALFYELLQKYWFWIFLYFVALFLIFKKKNPSFRNVFLPEVDRMDGGEFEHYCADLLRYNGFNRVSVTRRSGDQGVDIVAWKDGEKYAIQCKRFNNKLGNKPVQEVTAGRAIYSCDRAAVMTNSYYTDGARVAARYNHVELWDRNDLARMIREKQRYLNKSEPAQDSAIIPEKTDTPKLDWRKIGAGILCVIILAGVFCYRTQGEQGEQIKFPKIQQILPTGTIPTDKSLAPGETAAISHLSITVNQYMFARHNGNLKYLDMAEEGYLYCAVYVDVENIGNKEISLADASGIRSIVLQVDGQKQYGQSYEQDTAFLFGNSSLSPGEKLKSKVLNFKVPKETQHSDEELKLIITSNLGTKTEWTLR